MLDELISLAQLEGLKWLKAEIIAEHTKGDQGFSGDKGSKPRLPWTTIS